MSEHFFELSRNDQHEALAFARSRSGRPVHLLEKDIWVVWALRALFESPLAADLTFKGGTSLSKVYRVIDRFSEDLDLTCDIRKLIPDLLNDGSVLPATRSQAAKFTQAVRNRLPEWIAEKIVPVLQTALQRDQLEARIEVAGRENEQIQLHYPPLAQGTGYVAPMVTLEFGGRATGEPHQTFEVTCDIAPHLTELRFPVASPRVMSIHRTFWEKATAAHVYCAQGRIRSERYARHWHDLAAISKSSHFSAILSDRTVASAVASHKSFFFLEKDAAGRVIDYAAATSGFLKIVPEGEARAALASDYAAMVEDEILVGDALPFEELMKACEQLEELANHAAV